MRKKRVYSRLIDSLSSLKKKAFGGNNKIKSKANKSNNKFNKNNLTISNVLQVFKLYKSQPISLKILTSYMLLIATMYLLFAVYPTSLLFGALLGDSLARMLNLSLFIVILFLFYGIVARKYWAWQLALAWFSFEILNSLGSVILSGNANLLTRYVNTGAFYVTVINLIILWFIYKKKDVFTGRIYATASSSFSSSINSKRKVKSDVKRVKFSTNKIFASKHKFSAANNLFRTEDKVFVFSFSILVVLLAILIASSITSIYIETTALSKSIITEINHKSFEQAVFLCKSKFAQEKDVCNVVLAVAYTNQINADFGKHFCDDVEFSFYKITCMKALE